MDLALPKLTVTKFSYRRQRTTYGLQRMHEIRFSVPPVRRSMSYRSHATRVPIGASCKVPFNQRPLSVGLRERTTVTQAYNARIPLANTHLQHPHFIAQQGQTENTPMVSC